MDAMGVQGSIGNFENLFEDLDVKTAEMNGALDNVSGAAIDNDEVMTLLNEMRDVSAMEAKDGIGSTNSNAVANPNANAEANDIDAMQAKLNELKNL